MNYSLLSYSILSFIILHLSAIVSYKLQLVDLPDKRKLHVSATVFTGGAAISVTYILSILLFEIYNNSLNLIISMSFLMSMIGLIDDKYRLNVGGKLSLQVIPIF